MLNKGKTNYVPIGLQFKLYSKVFHTITRVFLSLSVAIRENKQQFVFNKDQLLFWNLIPFAYRLAAFKQSFFGPDWIIYP